MHNAWTYNSSSVIRPCLKKQKKRFSFIKNADWIWKEIFRYSLKVMLLVFSERMLFRIYLVLNDLFGSKVLKPFNQCVEKIFCVRHYWEFPEFTEQHFIRNFKDCVWIFHVFIATTNLNVKEETWLLLKLQLIII